MATFMMRVIEPKTQFDGWLVQVRNQVTGQWEQVPRYIGGGLVAFDSRAQAVKAAKAFTRNRSEYSVAA